MSTPVNVKLYESPGKAGGLPIKLKGVFDPNNILNSSKLCF